MLRTIWDDPWQEFDSLRNELNAAFSRMGMRGNGAGVYRPPATVTEQDDSIVMELDLPGVNAQDLEVEVDGRMLTIRGQRHRARGTLSYERVMTLPESLDTDTLHAELRDGVLNVTIAKNERARRRRIEVGGGDRQTIEDGSRSEPAEIGA